MANDEIASLRDTEARIVDETSSTPLFLRIHFLDGSIKYPARRKRPEEELHLNQGKADALATYRVVSDQATFDMFKIEVKALMHTDRTLLDTLIGFSNPFDAATWQPGGTSTFTVTTTMGSTDNADGTSVTHKAPKDAHRAAYLTNFEVLVNASTTDDVMKFAGVFWDEINYDMGNPAKLEATAEVYGGLTHATSFTTATEIS